MDSDHSLFSGSAHDFEKLVAQDLVCDTELFFIPDEDIDQDQYFVSEPDPDIERWYVLALNNLA
jgi:hypothetical protein